MISFLLRFLFLIPIGLVIVVGELIRKRGNPDTASRRYLLFLVWTSLAAWSVFTYTNWGMSAASMINLYSLILAPLLIGLTTLSFLNLRGWQSLYRSEKFFMVLLFLFLLLTQIWLAGMRSGEQRIEPLFIETVIVTVSFILSLVWMIGSRYLTGPLITAFLYLLLFNIMEGGALPFFEYGVETWLAVTAIALYVLLPALVLPTAAILLLHLLQPGPETDNFKQRRRIWQSVLLLLLLVSFLYTIVWLCIWDGTDDGIRGLLMIILSILISTAAGTVVATHSTTWRRWSGFGLAILISFGVTWAVAGPANWYRASEITEARAARLQRAIETAKEETGIYPASLGALVPAKLWRIPRPIIIRGQPWCYEGGPDFYRLGTLYREHWSSPDSSVRVYASAGNLPEGTWSCDELLWHWLAQQQALSNRSPAATQLPPE